MAPELTGREARRGRWLSLISVGCILGWAIPALVMLGKGFAVEDEGTYVLSYRFWDSNPYFVSGAQYFYGPVFEALGESIPTLRLLRLVMVIGANGWFAHCFLTWLGRQCAGELPRSRISLFLLLTAAGGMSYIWTPLTPGYYDLTADASLAAVSLLLLTLVTSPRPPSWIPLSLGVVGVLLVMTKWTAFPVLAVSLGVAIYDLASGSRKALLRYSALFMAGSVIALAGCQAFIVPIARFVSIMWKVSSLTAVGSHGMFYLARANLESTALLLSGAVMLGLPLIGALVLAVFLARHGHDDMARRCLLAAAVFTAVILPFAVGWRGGDQRGRVVVVVALAGLIVAALAGTRSGPGLMRGPGQARHVGVVLFVVPLAQAAGTNVPLLYVGGECLAMWVALVLMLVAGADRPELVRTAVVANLGVLIVAVAILAGTTTLRDPFKTTGVSEDTVPDRALGVRLSTGTVRQYDALESALRSHIVRDRTPMITLDQLAGITYLLGGVPAGSTWTDAVSPTRTAGILELACRNGDVPTKRMPVLIFNRTPDDHLAKAMRSCGFGSVDDYRRLNVRGGPPGLSVFVFRRAS